MPGFRRRSVRRRTQLLALAMAATLAPRAIGSPADIVNTSAPAVGAAAPEAHDIADGDASVATATGALQYSYPIQTPPGRLGMQPQLSLSYSSGAPIYGTVAAGWSLSGLPMIKWDASRGFRDRERMQDYREYLHYVSDLCGGRPLVEVTEPTGPNVDKAFRCAQDSSFARYERMAVGQPFAWRVLTPDGMTHYFGEQANVVGGLVVYLLARAPLTSSVDSFGNTIRYIWSFTDNEYRIDRIEYTSNPTAGLARFAEVRFTYVPATTCFGGTRVGATEDYRLFLKFVDGASKLTQIDAVALDPNANDFVQHTRTIILGYDPATENCGTTTAPDHAPYRELASITERAGGIDAPLVSLPPVEFAYGSAAIGLGQTLEPIHFNDSNSDNLSWGYRDATNWPSVEAMTLDVDGDGLPDRLTTSMVGQRCALDWQRNLGTGYFGTASAIPLPTLPWRNGTGGPSGLGTKGLGESCALNYQRTERETDPVTECGVTGAFLVYRFLDLDSDGLQDLVTAIHHSPQYDPDYPLEPPPFGAWPSCSGDLSACPAFDAACMDDVYTCDEFGGCGVDEPQLDACLATASRFDCGLSIWSQDIHHPGCMIAPTPDCWEIPGDEIDPPGLPCSYVAHKKCGLFVWEVFKNLGQGAFAAAPEMVLQPSPLESYGGDSSMGAGGFLAGSHAVTDFDGDGNTDLVVRGRFEDYDPVTDDYAPYWWWVFAGNGDNEFVKDPVTGLHAPELFIAFPMAWPSTDKGGFYPEFNNLKDKYSSGIGQVTDLNGDGLQDYLWKSPGGPGPVYGYFNLGWDFASSGPQGPTGADAEISRSYVLTTVMQGDDDIVEGVRSSHTRRIDLDGDGRADVYSSDPLDPSSAPLYFNTGGNQTQVGRALVANMGAAIVQTVEMADGVGAPRTWETKSDLIDLDGNGIAEAVSWNATTGLLERRGRPVDGMPPRLLIEVKNGRGLKTTVRYAPLSESEVVVNDPSSGTETATRLAAMPRTQWVVKSLRVDDDFESSYSETNYDFVNPVFGADDEDRWSFRGFDEVMATDRDGSKTIERYSFAPDWSGRKTATIVQHADASVHTIAETTWEARSLFASAITTYHPTIERSWTCDAGAATEAACKASPAGFTRSDTTWTPLSSTITSGPTLLHAETRKTTQDSEAFDDGDRDTRTTFALHADGSNYRLRDELIDAFVRIGGVDERFRSTEKDWDVDHKKLDLEKVRLDAAGTELAITEREYDATGNVENIRKPVQYAANGPKLKQTYDAKKLFVIRTVDELDLEAETDYEYGTGAKVSERGPNVNQCIPLVTCPPEPYPEREERKTKVDGLGRPLEVEVAIAYLSGTPSEMIYTYSKVETLSYVDAATPSVPTSVVHKRRIAHDEARWTEVKTELDGNGRPIKSTEKVNGTAPADAVTAYDYGDDGKLIAVAVPDPTANNSSQVTFTYSFDTVGRPTGMRRPDAVTPSERSGIDIGYDGLVETRTEIPGIAGVSTAGSAKTELETDAFGRLIKVREFTTSSLFAQTTYAFSPADEVKTIVDPEAVTTTLIHDLGGRRTSITRGPRTWSYGYDKNGNLTSETSPVPSGLSPALYVTSFVFDDLDRMTSKAIAPRGQTDGLSAADRDLFGAVSTQYTWDQALYNRMGRMVFAYTKTQTGQNVFNGRYYYDGEGNLNKENRGWQIGGLTLAERGESYLFDTFGKIRTVVHADGDGAGLEGPSRTRTIYDNRGTPQKLQLTRAGLAVQNVGVQTRNVAGLVTQRLTTQTTPALTLSSNWTYDKLGRVSSQDVQKNGTPSQVTRQDLTYWGNDDPRTLKHWIGATNLKDFSFTFDKRHELTGVSETAGALTATYTFGTAGRFTHATVQPIALPGTEVRPRDVDYQYSAQDPEAVTQLTIASGPGTGTPYATYAYDDAGNQTSRTYYTDASIPVPLPLAQAETWTFQYDGEDQLRRAIAPDGAIEEYWYEPNGSRAVIRKTPPSQGVVELRWFHKNTENELDATGALVKTWAYSAMGTPVARIENRNDRTEFQFHGLGSSTLATVESGIGDSTSAPPSGTTTSAFVYSPFAEVVEAAGGETETHRRRFSDKHSDSLTGLSYYGFRYLDQVSMTWTQADPVYRFAPDAAWAEPRRRMLYVFALGNPLKYVDPDGRDSRNWTDVAGLFKEAQILSTTGTIPGVVRTPFDASPKEVAISAGIALAAITGLWVLQEVGLAVAAAYGAVKGVESCSSNPAPRGGPGALVAPRYEPNPKHSRDSRISSGRTVSPEPTNGARALAKSVPVGEQVRDGGKRVAYDADSGEFVVFQITREGATGSEPDVYHGYAVKWDDLRREEQGALVEYDIVNRRGKPEPKPQ